jgi:predicted metal-binding membrane protein
VVMMVAMMTPSVSPTLLMFTSILRSRAHKPFARAAIFLLGYLLIWSGFSVAAALAQLVLHDAVSTATVIGGVVLIAAGIFQLTPLKHACLARCRSPQGFFMTEWREGKRGALVMGLRHGEFCLGCCWLLMSLLFVAGVMNLIWMAAIAIFVLVEKIAPFGEWTSRAAGVLLIGAGACMALSVIA